MKYPQGFDELEKKIDTNLQSIQVEGAKALTTLVEGQKVVTEAQGRKISEQGTNIASQAHQIADLVKAGKVQAHHIAELQVACAKLAAKVFPDIQDSEAKRCKADDQDV